MRDLSGDVWSQNCEWKHWDVKNPWWRLSSGKVASKLQKQVSINSPNVTVFIIWVLLWESYNQCLFCVVFPQNQFLRDFEWCCLSVLRWSKHVWGFQYFLDFLSDWSQCLWIKCCDKSLGYVAFLNVKGRRLVILKCPMQQDGMRRDPLCSKFLSRLLSF